MAEDDLPRPSLHIVPAVDDERRRRLEAEALVARHARDREFAEARLRYKLRSLAANILRIVRGAGKPYDLPREAAEMLKALDEYHNVFGDRPRAEAVNEMLSLDITRGSLSDQRRALETMTKGALQMAASALVEQRAQMSSGKEELREGIRLWNQYIADENAKWARKQPAPKLRKPKL